MKQFSVVEDDARVRRVTVARLRSLGYEVIEADSGAAALSLLAAHPKIAMLFTDVVMAGGMNGDELADVALTAKPDRGPCSLQAMLSRRSRAFGQRAWLKKPYTAADLAGKVREILSQ